MKEKIYTIPINEAFEENTECPLCYIEKRLAQEAIDYGLGAAMMEPEHRELSNEKGFCNKHMDMLYKSGNKLPLALVLDTRLEQVRKEISKMSLDGGFFKKKQSGIETTASCVICDKLEKDMNRYMNVLIDMWHKDKDFRDGFSKSKGFCLVHFEKLFKTANDKEFLKSLLDLEKRELERIQADIHKFTTMFDYRSNGQEWGTAKDAPVRTGEKLSGYFAD